MSVRVERGGLLTTIQAAPRVGRRHWGVPASGPADPLSFALANRLVGNPAFAPALETTLDGPVLVFERPARIAVTGAPSTLMLNGQDCPLHATLALRAGDRLEIGSCPSGVRSYVAFAGGLAAATVLGSASTYLPAGLGGFRGRALEQGDRLDFGDQQGTGAGTRTPAEYLPGFGHAWGLRACGAAEWATLAPAAQDEVLGCSWTVTRRADRMGIELAGPIVTTGSGGRMLSAPVFPGTVQCPESGKPFLLGADAQTTGGYPRLLQVARCDRHLLGQLRPGDRLRFLWREPDAAAAELRAKRDFWRRWLPDIDTVL